MNKKPLLEGWIYSSLTFISSQSIKSETVLIPNSNNIETYLNYSSL